MTLLCLAANHSSTKLPMFRVFGTRSGQALIGICVHCWTRAYALGLVSHVFRRNAAHNLGVHATPTSFVSRHERGCRSAALLPPKWMVGSSWNRELCTEVRICVSDDSFGCRSRLVSRA